MKKFKKAFTLAEVLITLGVIGVVAAITMPAVIANINERVNSERQANIAQKVTQAMEQMRAHGLLNTKYASTDAFVDELQKYLKIAKRCDSEHIADCWPTEKVTTSDGEEYEVSKAKTGASLKHKNNKTGNVGLVLADGASLIMTYDENGDNTLDVGSEVRASRTQLPVGGGKMKDFPYTTSVTGAIDFVMDVNGGKGPNSETINGKWHDIRSFNGAQFAKGMVCDFEVGNLCVKNLGTTYSCIDTCSDTTWDSYGSSYSYCPCNFWAGAKKTCAGLEGMHLATRDELNTIYATKGTNNNVATLSGWFWSSEEANTNGAWGNYIDNNTEGAVSKSSRNGALCVGNN
ncbi:prepilin-type N-terminal cleavage/methylation domain-containing protein [bacterium]|nr:prepilin-type N-terminal cleavage/methylation domain-containing protein [bacterium]